LELQAINYPTIEMEEMVVFEDNPEENRFRIVESYRLPKPWLQNGKEDRVFDYYPREVASWLPSEPSGSRSRAMEIAHPLDNRLVAVLELPEKWEFSSNPFWIDNPFFEFSESAS